MPGTRNNPTGKRKKRRKTFGMDTGLCGDLHTGVGIVADFHAVLPDAGGTDRIS